MDILSQVVNYTGNKDAWLLQIANKKDAVSCYIPRYQKGYSGKLGKVVMLFLYTIEELFVRRVVIPLKVKFHAICELRLLRQINRDKKVLGDRQKVIARKAEKICRKEQLFTEMNERNVSLAKDLGVATYASTERHLSFVFLEWAKSLLVRAKEQNLRLVFMARDGLGPYEMAKILKERNSEFSSVPIHYIYLSRALVEGEKAKLSQYLSQEGLLTDDRKLLFVDIGFLGTMVPKIRAALSEAGVPSDPSIDKNAAEFEFFISTADKANGYVSSPQNVLPTVISAGSNRGVHWIEATHHGVLQSATALVSDENNRLIPNSVYQKATCKEKNPLDFLCVRMAGKALRDCARRAQEISTEWPRTNTCPDHLKTRFDQILHHVKNDRFLYVSKDNQ
jgi:hypothetical protein